MSDGTISTDTENGRALVEEIQRKYPALIPALTSAMQQLRRPLTCALDLPAWHDFPRWLMPEEAEALRGELFTGPIRVEVLEKVERRIIRAWARSSWTLQDCYWRDGEE